MSLCKLGPPEIRRRDADAAVTAAQNEGAGAEQKPPAIYVKRAAG